MTQPVNPGQPYVPPGSVPSTPGAFQAQPTYSAPSAPGAFQAQQPYPGQVPGGVPGQPAGAAQDSFLGNLFSTSRGFVERYGSIIMITASVAFVLMWLYSAYVAGDSAASYNLTTGNREYNVGRFLVYLLANAPYCVLQIAVVRLIIELVHGSATRARA